MNTETISPFDIEVFYDGACPLCVREVNMLRRWDKRNRIKFTDISEDGFDASAIGKTHDELMAKMHGRDPLGNWLTGVEVFRRMYAAVGFGPLVSLSRLPVVSQALDLGYSLFAKNRLRLTGRCEADVCSTRPHLEKR